MAHWKTLLLDYAEGDVKSPRLTIGMAAYDDPHGVLFTLQSLRMHHGCTSDEVELVLVDASSHLPNSQPVAKFAHRAGVHYVPFEGVTGTSAPRERIFAEARGEFVLVLDAHVLLQAGAIERLLQWTAAHPDCHDLLTGPMLADDLRSVSTHYNPGWRGEMWGKWAQAWRSPQGETVTAINVDGQAVFVRVADQRPAGTCAKLPPTKYGFHSKTLREAGFTRLGLSPDDDFIIPGMGLGCFCCKRDAWVGFNPQFRGLGGAEHYIHEKFRKRGHAVRSLGFLSWWHRFPKFANTAPTMLIEDRVRNIVIGHRELGLPLDEAKQHFVNEAKRLTADQWDAIVENADKPTLERLYEQIRAERGALDSHMPMLRRFAGECQYVTEFTRSKGSTAAFYAGINGGTVRTWTADKNSLLEQLADVAPQHELHQDGLSIPETIAPTDLLFLSVPWMATEMQAALEALSSSVQRRIVIHSPAKSLDGIREFTEGQDVWFVAGLASGQGGMIVLSRDQRDRPKQPIKAWNKGKGPGTELKKILSSLGIEAGPTCDCRARANEMDEWGVEGCKANRQQIIDWMREGQERWGWKDKWTGAARAVMSGLAFKLNPLDPFPGLVDEAIRRAEG